MSGKEQLPHLYTPYDREMWESINERNMKLQWCPQSNEFRYPPGPLCPKSLSFGYEWRSISGNGKILSWTVFHRQYLPAYPSPHLVVAVQLQEGPIMVSNMDYALVDKLALDAPVRLIYEKHPDGYLIPSFTLALDEK